MCVRAGGRAGKACAHAPRASTRGLCACHGLHALAAAQRVRGPELSKRLALLCAPYPPPPSGTHPTGSGSPPRRRARPRRTATCTGARHRRCPGTSSCSGCSATLPAPPRSLARARRPRTSSAGRGGGPGRGRWGARRSARAPAPCVRAARPALPPAPCHTPMHAHACLPCSQPSTHVRLAQVPVQGRRVELREAVHLVDVGVQAVRHGDVDEAVVGAQGHGGLGALLGERVQPRARPAAQDDAQHGLQRAGGACGGVGGPCRAERGASGRPAPPC